MITKTRLASSNNLNTIQEDELSMNRSKCSTSKDNIRAALACMHIIFRGIFIRIQDLAGTSYFGNISAFIIAC